MGGHPLAVVIPAYNEQETIGSVVKTAVAYADVFVVNDCSTDDTAVRATAAGATVLTNKHNLGYDRTLSAGFDEVRRRHYRAAVIIDADGEHDPSILEHFHRLLIDDNVPMVLGVRPRPSRFAEHIFVFVIKQWLGPSDILCGCKGFQLSLLDENDGLDHVQSTNTELATASIRRGHKFEELFITGNSRADPPRFGGFLKANFKILASLYRVLRYLVTIQAIPQKKA